MIEKHIVIEDIDPVELYGVGNCHLQIIKSLYPKLRIVARDNVIRVLGDEEEMCRFEENIEKIRRHLLKFNTISDEDILDIIKGNPTKGDGSDDALLYNISGRPIRSRSANQQQIVDAFNENDMVFAVGPAGTGKSQIAYAVAKILKMSWTTLEMSSINDPEQLTGSSRVYSNAKPGLIMEAFEKAESSNLVFIINELDKAAAGKGNGNPADVLLTLLDNLGFTDNYIECNIPTGGVYPIATANDRDQISAPLMSRFAVIELPDYTFEEKREIFKRFTMPKILKRIGLSESECIITEDGIDAIIDTFKNTSGIRDLEQAAEHVAANALYRIEVEKIPTVIYDAQTVKALL